MKASSPLALFDDLRSWRSGVADDPAWLCAVDRVPRPRAAPRAVASATGGARANAAPALLCRAIEAQLAAVGVAPPARPLILALIVQALDHSVGVFEALAPDEVPDGTFFDVLALLFRATVALSQQNTG